eukprot:621967-Pyramimonas_sp.AAC.1
MFPDEGRASQLALEATSPPGRCVMLAGRKRLFAVMLLMRRLQHEYNVQRNFFPASTTIAIDASSKGGRGR